MQNLDIIKKKYPHIITNDVKMWLLIRIKDDALENVVRTRNIMYKFKNSNDFQEKYNEALHNLMNKTNELIRHEQKIRSIKAKEITSYISSL